MQTEGEHTYSTQKGPELGFEPRTFKQRGKQFSVKEHSATLLKLVG